MPLRRLHPAVGSPFRAAVVAVVCACGVAAASGGRVSAADDLPAPPPRPGELALPAAPEPIDPDAVIPAPHIEAAAAGGMSAEELRLEIDRAVAVRLAGIPRPRYIPATDVLPPQGLVFLKTDPRRGEFPFSMALGGFLQLRWLEFARANTDWTDSAGVSRPVDNINAFNINRFLLSFHGHVVDERLVYNFALFGTTNIGVRAGVVPIGMLGWKFSEAAIVGGGMTQVVGTREWDVASPWTIGVDRSMANTFFRPGFSPGVLAMGSLLDGELHYRAGVWNAIDGGTAGVLRRGTSMAWAGTSWWEPLGPFGFSGSDMEVHADPVFRLGTSGVVAPTTAQLLVGLNPEDTLVRLSDGTRLTETGALGPGSTVDQYLYRLASLDAAWKWRGIGLFGEYYWRLLDNFRGTGTFSRSSVFDHGAMGYVSWCFVPRTYEIYGRSSFVTGPYGSGQEYGGGFNWYVRSSRQARLTLEALSIIRSPAQNFLYPYRAGYSGTALQTQFVVAF